MASNSNFKKIAVILVIILILLFSFILRFNTFWFSHFAGDQIQYIGLAMKLDKFGLKGYSLRRIDVRFSPARENKQLVIAEVIPSSKNSKGNILQSLIEDGRIYYDKEVFYKPYGFAYLLVLSHRLFNRNQPYLTVVTHLGKFVRHFKPNSFFHAQFYAVIFPLVFSLLAIFLTFILGGILFSKRVGLYAATIMAVNPVSLLTAHKVWADDMTMFFDILALVLYILSLRKRHKALFGFFAGVSCALSVLAKQTGGFIIISLFLYHLYSARKVYRYPLQVLKMIFNKSLIFFLLGFVFVSGHWFAYIYQVYNSFIYIAIKDNPVVVDDLWKRILNSRPNSMLLYSAGVIYLSPIFIFLFFSFRNLLFSQKKEEKEGLMLLWLWFIVFWVLVAVIFKVKEHRYLLPSYPAIALLSAFGLERFRSFLAKSTHSSFVSEGLPIIILLLSVLWSVPIGLRTVYGNGALLLYPF